ncbi:MAG TPA: AraC family transcriptional regulator [Ramlibacter sp.]|nr:AraC family transcriptional regulator [Ramlibacter sp.]
MSDGPANLREPSRGFRMVTSDLSEAIAAVSRLYCPHDVTVRGREVPVSSRLEVLRGGPQPIVELRYSAPVRIDAGRFENLLLVKTCVEGSATTRQDDASCSLAPGRTVPLSPSADTVLDFEAGFVQRSIRLSMEGMNRLCASHLNRPLDEQVRFELRPFSSALERAWSDAAGLVLRYERQGLALPPASAARLDEFMLALLLELHPHNHSEAMREPHALSTPRAVREAEHLMRTAPPGAGRTISAIARAVGVSMRSLEAGFREWRQVTPSQFFRRVRLAAAHAELSQPDESTTVSMVALSHGFPHLSRFSAYYRAEFGENPGQTLLRARRRKPP